MSKIAILKEFWTFLKVRKKLWLAPIVFILLLLGLLIVVTSNTALAPFIYANKYNGCEPKFFTNFEEGPKLF